MEVLQEALVTVAQTGACSSQATSSAPAGKALLGAGQGWHTAVMWRQSPAELQLPTPSRKPLLACFPLCKIPISGV